MVGGVPTVTRALAAGGQLTVHLRGSVRWPWYDGMRLAAVPGAAGRRLLAGFAPDVIHIHSPVTLGVTALAAARRLRIPVIYTNHYLPVNVRPARRHPPRLAEAAFYSFVVGFANRCSLVTAPTGTALRLLLDRGLRVPSGVVSNGIDLARFRPGPPEPGIRDRYGLAAGRPVILYVGRLSPEKRVNMLLHAVARLARDAQLAIAGTGPADGALRAAAARLGAGATGPVPRPRARRRPARAVPGGGRVRHHVRGGTAEPRRDGGDGQRPAGGRGPDRRAIRPGCPLLRGGRHTGGALCGNRAAGGGGIRRGRGGRGAARAAARAGPGRAAFPGGDDGWRGRVRGPVPARPGHPAAPPGRGRGGHLRPERPAAAQAGPAGGAGGRAADGVRLRRQHGRLAALRRRGGRQGRAGHHRRGGLLRRAAGAHLVRAGPGSRQRGFRDRRRGRAVRARAPRPGRRDPRAARRPGRTGADAGRRGRAIPVRGRGPDRRPAGRAGHRLRATAASRRGAGSSTGSR